MHRVYARQPDGSPFTHLPCPDHISSIHDLICTGLLLPGSGSPPGPQQKQSIQADIDDQNSDSQCHLSCTGQAWRIEQRLDIMFDKTSLVAGNPSLPAQLIFQRSEWTDSTRYHDPGGPEHRWQMNPEQVSPPVHQQAAQNSKKHEQQVDNDYNIGSCLVEHLTFR